MSAILARHTVVPIVVGDFSVVLGLIAPDVLIDARMRKRDCPETQRGLSPLTIGLGPKFVAGDTTDVVVETSWEQLGDVVTRGTALPLGGEPRAMQVTGAIATCTRRWPAHCSPLTRSGSRSPPVRSSRIDATSLTAPRSGVLRGLTHDGVLIAAGTKVIEIDPRGDPALVRGIGERPALISDGVLRAIDAALGSLPQHGRMYSPCMPSCRRTLLCLPFSG